MLDLDPKETQAQVEELLKKAKKLPKGSVERLRLLELARIGMHFADLMEARALPDEEIEPEVLEALTRSLEKNPVGGSPLDAPGMTDGSRKSDGSETTPESATTSSTKKVKLPPKAKAKSRSA
jgi:hypothetical protein